MHRFISLLALGFTLLHIYILLGDPYFRFSTVELSLPFASPYRAIPLAIGVFATYALVIVVASFYVRRMIGYRVWRLIHYLTFALFISAAIHGILAGSDTTEPWARAIYLISTACVFSLIAHRLQYRLPDTQWGLFVRLIGATAVAAAASFVAFSIVAN